MNRMTESTSAESRWAGLYRLGGVTAFVVVVLLLGEIAVYAALPQPSSVVERFKIFNTNWIVGLLTLDLLGMIAYLLFVPTMLALYMTLRRSSEAIALVSTVLFFVGIAAFFASNTAFPLLALSRQYATADSETARSMIVAAGHNMLTLFNENAFHVSYVIVSAAWLLISSVMLRSKVFGRTTAYGGLVTGAAGVVAVVLELSWMNALSVAILLYFAAIVFLLIWVGLVGRRLCKIGFGDLQKQNAVRAIPERSDEV